VTAIPYTGYKLDTGYPPLTGEREREKERNQGKKTGTMHHCKGNGCSRGDCVYLFLEKY